MCSFTAIFFIKNKISIFNALYMNLLSHDENELVRDDFPHPHTHIQAHENFASNIFAFKYSIFKRNFILLILKHDVLHCVTLIHIA